MRLLGQGHGSREGKHLGVADQACGQVSGLLGILDWRLEAADHGQSWKPQTEKWSPGQWYG